MRPGVAICVVVLLSTAAVAGLSAAAAAEDGTATVDRITGPYAVVLHEDGGETTDQRVVPVSALPEAARHEGATVRHTADGYVYDAETTDRRERTMRRLFERLASRLGGGHLWHRA